MILPIIKKLIAERMEDIQTNVGLIFVNSAYTMNVIIAIHKK